MTCRTHHWISDPTCFHCRESDNAQNIERTRAASEKSARYHEAAMKAAQVAAQDAAYQSRLLEEQAQVQRTQLEEQRASLRRQELMSWRSTPDGMAFDSWRSSANNWLNQVGHVRGIFKHAWSQTSLFEERDSLRAQLDEVDAEIEKLDPRTPLQAAGSSVPIFLFLFIAFIVLIWVIGLAATIFGLRGVADFLTLRRYGMGELRGMAAFSACLAAPLAILSSCAIALSGKKEFPKLEAATSRKRELQAELAPLAAQLDEWCPDDIPPDVVTVRVRAVEERTRDLLQNYASLLPRQSQFPRFPKVSVVAEDPTWPTAVRTAYSQICSIIDPIERQSPAAAKDSDTP